MHKLLLTTAVLAFAGSAHATQITTGAGPVDSFDIIGAAGHITAMTMGFSTPALLGASDVGTADWSMTAIMAGPPTAGVFPVTHQDPWTISFTFPDATLTGNLTVTEIDDGSLNPHLTGTLIPTADTGLLAGLSAGIPFDAAFSTLAGTLEVFTGFDYPASLSAGEFDIGRSTRTSEVPEPATLALLGAGLLAIGLLRRKLEVNR